MEQLLLLLALGVLLPGATWGSVNDGTLRFSAWGTWVLASGGHGLFGVITVLLYVEISSNCWVPGIDINKVISSLGVCQSHCPSQAATKYIHREKRGRQGCSYVMWKSIAKSWFSIKQVLSHNPVPLVIYRSKVIMMHTYFMSLIPRRSLLTLGMPLLPRSTRDNVRDGLLSPLFQSRGDHFML